MDSIRDMGTTLLNDVEKARERVREVAEVAKEKGRETWKDLRHQGKDAMSGAEKNVKEVWEDSKKLVHKHPGKALSLALLVGAVIGGVLVAMRSGAKSKVV